MKTIPEAMDFVAVQIGIISEELAKLRGIEGNQYHRVLVIGDEIVRQLRQFRQHQDTVRLAIILDDEELLSMVDIPMRRTMERIQFLQEAMVETQQ